MPVNYLDLNDLDRLIDEFEQRWNAKSLDMLKDPSVRERIPEHVLLRWETYIRQRLMLREYDVEVRAVYLSNIPKSDSENHVTSQELCDLAA